MRLGILGGTFDPVHIGHLRLAIEAREQLMLDKVILEVAALSPFKQDTPPTSSETRFEMVSVAIREEPCLVAGERELRRPPPSFAVETVESYVAEGHEVFYIMGADTLASLTEWREPERLVSRAVIAVGSRPGWEAKTALSRLPEKWGSNVELFRMPLLDVSSSDIRTRVAEGRSIRYLVPEGVARLIEERRLYR